MRGWRSGEESWGGVERRVERREGRGDEGGERGGEEKDREDMGEKSRKEQSRQHETRSDKGSEGTTSEQRSDVARGKVCVEEIILWRWMVCVTEAVVARRHPYPFQRKLVHQIEPPPKRRLRRPGREERETHRGMRLTF